MRLHFTDFTESLLIYSELIFVFVDRMDSVDGSNDDDDLCQHPDGCLRSLFTYCPHCHLFLYVNNSCCTCPDCLHSSETFQMHDPFESTSLADEE